MKFIKIKSRGDYHWALLIDNEDDFKRFLEDKETDLTNAYFEAKEASQTFKHVTTLAYVVGMELEKHHNRKTFVDDVMIYTNVFLKPYIESFYKERKIVVWKNNDKWQHTKYGGFMPYSAFKNHPGNLEIVKTVERNELVFPRTTKETFYTEDDISIKKWDMAKHYYAKVGKLDVTDKNGNIKWNSHKRAMEVAKEFMNELNKEFENE